MRWEYFVDNNNPTKELTFNWTIKEHHKEEVKIDANSANNNNDNNTKKESNPKIKKI